jgi:hypothetical protein
VALDYRRMLSASTAALARIVSRRQADSAPADERLGALLARKSAVRTGRGEARRSYEPAAGAAPVVDDSFIAGARSEAPGGSAPKAESAPRPAEKPKAPEPPPKPQEDSYTSRLLAAKKRAMDRHEKKD